MNALFRHALGAPTRESLQDLGALRERLVSVIAAIGVIVGTPLIALNVYRAVTVHWNWAIVVQIFLYCGFVFAALFRRRVHYRVRAGLMLPLLLVSSIGGLLTWGFLGSGFLSMFGCIILTALIFGSRWCYLIFGVCAVAVLATYWGFNSGALTYGFDFEEYSRSAGPWLHWMLSFSVFSVGIGYSVSWVSGSLQRSIKVLREHEVELKRANEILQKQASELEEQAEELIEQRDKAESANRAKDQFLSVISHELRTPLNPILGLVDVLKQEVSMSSDSRHHLGLMQTSGEHLLRLIDQVVDFSEIDCGKIAIVPHRVEVAQLARDLELLLGSAARDKGLDFEVAVGTCDMPWVMADHRRLAQVLNNLGMNAVKFTQSGSVRIFIETERTGIEQGSLCMRFEDTGVGIEEEKQSELFQAFYQVDTSRTRGYGGLGIGLSICKGIVGAMDGTLELESELGVGSVFAVQIPVSAAQPDSIHKMDTKKSAMRFSRELEILVVEDDFVNQRVITALLRRMGARAVCANNGQEALSTLEERSFDAVLMDVSMPKMDGISATREIRKSPKTRKLPVIALTANSYSQSERSCREAGMNAFLSKPAKIEQIFETVSSLTA